MWPVYLVSGDSLKLGDAEFLAVRNIYFNSAGEFQRFLIEKCTVKEFVTRTPGFITFFLQWQGPWFTYTPPHFITKPFYVETRDV